jgi:hypothetical protein
LWRPASEWDSVVPSTISSSPPTGKAESITEVILATNPTVEGEATANYIAELCAQYGVAIEPDVIRPDAVERRQVPHQHEVAAGILPGLLNGGADCRTFTEQEVCNICSNPRRQENGQICVVESPAPR